METKFIKYKPEQINLAQLYRFSSGGDLSDTDVHDGTLIVGYAGDGKYLATGYLRGITLNSETGDILYEIANAIEGQEYITCIEKPYRVESDRLPYFAAVIDSSKKPLVGKIIKCDGELAVMDIGCGKSTVNVNSVLGFVPYFKERNKNG